MTLRLQIRGCIWQPWLGLFIRWIEHYPLENAFGFPNICPLDISLSRSLRAVTRNTCYGWAHLMLQVIKVECLRWHYYCEMLQVNLHLLYGCFKAYWQPWWDIWWIAMSNVWTTRARYCIHNERFYGYTAGFGCNSKTYRIQTWNSTLLIWLPLGHNIQIIFTGWWSWCGLQNELGFRCLCKNNMVILNWIVWQVFWRLW